MSKIDTDYTEEVTCPHCGYEFSDSWEFDNSAYLGLFECGNCEREFYAHRNIEITYSTQKPVIGTCSVCKKKNVAVEDYNSSLGKLHSVGVHCCLQKEISRLQIEEFRRLENRRA